MAKKGKLSKRSDAYKVYASSYYVDILNFFNMSYNLKIWNLQLELNLLTKLRGFKLVKTLVIEFENIDSDDATK